MELFVSEKNVQEVTDLQTSVNYTPNNWRIVSLEEITLEIGSGVTPRGGETSYQQDGIALIRSQNVLMNKLSLNNVAFISLETHQSMLRSAIIPGDVLLNITGASIGRVAVVPESLKVANVNQHVCKIRLKQTAFPRFISYFLSSTKGQSQILGSQFGTTRQGLNYGNVRALRIPLPPLPEQRAITRILQTAQSAIQARRNELDLERERKAALMQHLFTHGTRGEATKMTEIGKMPESWCLQKLGDVITLQRGFDLPTDQRLPGNIPVVSSSGISGTHAVAKVSGPGVITGRYGTIGQVFYIENDFWPLNTTLFVKDFKGNNPLFISYFLQTINLQTLNDKTSVPGINRNHAHMILVCLPSKEEQLEMAKIFAACDSKLAALEKEIALQEELFRALLEELMSGQLAALPLVEEPEKG